MGLELGKFGAGEGRRDQAPLVLLPGRGPGESPGPRPRWSETECGLPSHELTLNGITTGASFSGPGLGMEVWEVQPLPFRPRLGQGETRARPLRQGDVQPPFFRFRFEKVPFCPSEHFFILSNLHLHVWTKL